MKKLIISTIAVLLCGAVNVQAVGDWDIYSDAEIHDSDEYWNVSVFDTPPDHTTLDMFGGSVDSMAAFDESTVNISGGYVSTLNSYELSTVNAFGGFVHSLWAYDTGTANVWGDVGMISLGARESGVVNMSGGTTQHLGAGESGTVNVYGGLVNSGLNAWDFGAVNIFGYDLVKTSTGGHYGYGQVYGFFIDDTAFTIDFSTLETYSHVNLVPEPSSLILLGLGGLMIKRKR